MRPSNRAPDALRPVSIERNVARYAEGSCLVKFGSTHVLCTASLEDKPPPWLRGQGRGWVTAEYAMLPRSCRSRVPRDVTQGRLSGRSHEIQRLIGRSLRAVVDRPRLGPRTIVVDCDVLFGDGGTRCAAISGAYAALAEACRKLARDGRIAAFPLADQVAAVSVGIVGGKALLDLDYAEDSAAEVDLNVVMTGRGLFVEIQGTAERAPFGDADLRTLIALAKNGISQILRKQKKALAAVCSKQ